MTKWSVNHRVDTCAGCLAWGFIFATKLCAACYMHAQRWPQGICPGCQRQSALRRGYCRLCWDHARTPAYESAVRHVTAVHRIAEVRHPQLFFANMAASNAPRRRLATAAQPPSELEEAAVWPADGQLCLFRLAGTGTVAYVDQLHQPLAGEHAIRTAHHVLRHVSEAHGWGETTSVNARTALTRLLASYAEGDQLTYSRVFIALRRSKRRYSVERTTEILQEMGIYVDDRRPRLDAKLEARLAGLAPGIAGEVEQWVRGLTAGGTRRAPRAEQTALRYLDSARPALLAWSQRYDHLRQVIRDDVLAEVESLSGNTRDKTLVALRSLFSAAEKSGAIFRNPTSRIRVGAARGKVLQPLPDEQVRQTAAAATRPADPLIVALATIHATRNTSIRRLLLDDVDLGNRRITIAGRVHPLDQLTYRALLHWLNYRRATWPTTPNPHLIITRRTATCMAPVSSDWLTDTFRGLHATLERLRMDRHLEEALAHRADPLHLAVVFGIDEKTALRYANSARQLLPTAAERDAAG
jgi:hypothetical protein